MRKITEQAAAAFHNGLSFSQSNTAVIPSALPTVNGYQAGRDGAAMQLHGHTIAAIDRRQGRIVFSFCGYQTNVTKERLNGIFDFLGFKPFSVKNGQLLYRGSFISPIATYLVHKVNGHWMMYGPVE